MKILYVTTVGSTMGFFKRIVKELIDKGNTVDIATNDNLSKVDKFFEDIGCKIYNITTSRSPFSIGNFLAIKQIRKIAEKYDVVHCHTPLAGMATRLACRKLRKKGKIKVIYTAHGFHFYKGAPKKNWIIYYPIEKICANWTDVLITINKEDFEIANKKMHAKKIEYVPGVGIDVLKISQLSIDNNKKRDELSIPQNAYIILSVGELNDNKNHQIVIRAISKICNDKIHYIIAGQGDNYERLLSLSKKLNVNTHLLGYRKDVLELYKCSNLYVHPSYREGLPVALMEASASNLDVICSNIRGCKDIVQDDVFDPNDELQLSKMIESFINGKTNKEKNFKNIKQFDINLIIEKMFQIYFQK